MLQYYGPRRNLLLTLKLELALETKIMGGACYPRGADGQCQTIMARNLKCPAELATNGMTCFMLETRAVDRVREPRGE
jgi:hypothetical protein